MAETTSAATGQCCLVSRAFRRLIVLSTFVILQHVCMVQSTNCSSSSVTMNVQCGICQDQINVCNKKIVALQCGHVFHEMCISKWLDTCSSKPTCPHCRRQIDKKKMLVLYLELTPVHNFEEDPNVMKGVIADLQQEKSLATAEVVSLKRKNEKLSNQIAGLKEQVVSLEATLNAQAQTTRLLALTKNKLDDRSAELLRVTSELDQLRQRHESLRAANTFFSSGAADAEIENVSTLTREDLALLVCTFKKDGQKCLKKQNDLQMELSRFQNENRELQRSKSKLQEELQVMQRIVDTLKPSKVPPSSSSPPQSEVETSSNLSPKMVTPKVVTPHVPTGKVIKRKLMRPSPPGAKRLIVPEVYDGLGGHSRISDLNSGFHTNYKIVANRKPFTSKSIFRKN